MAEFWKTIPTIQAERGGNYHAYPLFGAQHLAELGVSALFLLGFCLLYRGSAPPVRRRLLVLVTALLLADELLKYAVTLATGQWSWAYLPLHLCSINLFVCLYHTLTGRRWCKEVLYALCIPGAAAALLLPTWRAAPVWNIMHLHSQSVHTLLILYPLLLLLDGFRPDPRRIPQVLAFLGVTALPISALNRILGTNFYFLNGAEGNVLTALFAQLLGSNFYVLGFVPVIAVLLALMYLPWWLAARRRRSAPAR